MDPTSDNLHIFQKNLNSDADLQSSYINADNSDGECKNFSQTRKRTIIPDTSRELLFQLITQHQVLAKTQKNMYRLQAELDKEEISSRYTKLDLNNATVKISETKEKLVKVRHNLYHARIENWVSRVILFIYVLFQVYSLFQWVLYDYGVESDNTCTGTDLC